MAANKQDSNATGLRYAEESELGVLPGTLGADAVWYPFEPNSYADFGGQISTVARNPINQSRQRKKGVVTDLDASGGFNQDLTFDNTTRVLQGFFFATMHEKATTRPLNSDPVVLTGILAANDDYTAASGLPTSIVSGDLVYASGFGVAANNGLKRANATSTGIAISVADALSDEATPPAAAGVKLVGHQFGTGTSAIALNGSLVRLTESTLNLTTLPLTVGEWIFIGGDGATLRFDNNVGFARISAIAATYLEFDKVTFTPSTEAGTGDTIQIFYCDFIKNESDPTLIVRRTYQLERTLGEDDDGTMSEYLVGAVPNELTLNIAQADKVTMDLSFVAIDFEQRDGLDDVKIGDRPSLTVEDAYNTSSDITRIKLAIPGDAAVAPLFAFATEMTLSLNNNVTPNKAIGVLGAFDTSAGTFEVGGNMTAYFANVEAVAAVRNNTDITLDVFMLKNNKALMWDIPLLSLGDGRLSVEQDQPITLPLETNAAESSFGHTLMFARFNYLPDIAG